MEANQQQAITLTEKIEQWLTSGNLIDQLIPLLIHLGIAALIFVVGRWAISQIIRFVNKLLMLRGADLVLTGFVSAVLNTVLKFILLILILEQIGINTTSLLALLGAAGITVGLALKDSLANFASGVMLILFKPFRVGDSIEAAGVSGEVEKISVFNSVLKTGDNKQIIVPNAQIYNGTITNFTAKPTRRVEVSLAISFSENLQGVKSLLESLARQDERVLEQPAPLVAVSALTDKGVGLIVRVWVRTPDYWPVYWRLLEKIKSAFDEKAIVIAGMRNEVHLIKDQTSIIDDKIVPQTH